MNRSMSVLVPAALLVAGCSDPKAATKANFEAVINAYAEQHPSCFTLPRGDVADGGAGETQFPLNVEVTPRVLEFTRQINPGRLEQFEALVSAGLLKMDSRRLPKPAAFGASAETAAVHVRSYSLTNEGTAALEKADERDDAFLGSRAPRLCFGTPVVDEVVRFTEPADAMGAKVSMVAYTYHLKNVPAWALVDRMRKAFPELESSAAKGQEATAHLALTNEGWIDARELAARH